LRAIIRQAGLIVEKIFGAFVKIVENILQKHTIVLIEALFYAKIQDEIRGIYATEFLSLMEIFLNFKSSESKL
jgi:hypothetical protein